MTGAVGATLEALSDSAGAVAGLGVTCGLGGVDGRGAGAEVVEGAGEACGDGVGAGACVCPHMAPAARRKVRILRIILDTFLYG
jgi:hypothetical protein